MIRRLGVLLVLAVAGAAFGCLWDSDTFAEEALTQKDVAEIVRGRLGKHSDFFYEQKAAYTKRLVDSSDAGMERYDDLAVAYDKLGKLDEAVAVMTAKEQRFPKQYTTLANLGSFHAHQRRRAAQGGQAEAGVWLLSAAAPVELKTEVESAQR